MDRAPQRGRGELWEERGGAQQIRQEEWLHYQDGDDEAGIAVRLGWFDAHNTRVMRQDLIAVLKPLDRGETWLELQMTFTTTMEELKLAKTNFGFLGLRVAKSLSAHYGGGELTNSAGDKGEKAIFAKPALWVDYSGPILGETWEGVTWFDHPSNPGHPTSWHVRDDGWMSAAFNLREEYLLPKAKPLQLRYGFHVHQKALEPKGATAQVKSFADSPAWQLAAAERPWRFQLRRK